MTSKPVALAALEAGALTTVARRMQELFDPNQYDDAMLEGSALLYNIVKHCGRPVEWDEVRDALPACAFVLRESTAALALDNSAWTLARLMEGGTDITLRAGGCRRCSTPA